MPQVVCRLIDRRGGAKRESCSFFSFFVFRGTGLLLMRLGENSIEDRRAVGMPNPIRDKSGGKSPVMSEWLRLVQNAAEGETLCTNIGIIRVELESKRYDRMRSWASMQASTPVCEVRG